MTSLTPLDHLPVLHHLRRCGAATAAAVAEACFIGEPHVGRTLDALAAEGLVTAASGSAGLYRLTPAGRVQHAELVAAHVEASGTRAVIEGCYERFLPLNVSLLAVCTAWQLRQRDGDWEMNDHSDASYDASVVARLLQLHDRARPLLAELADALPQFARYEGALSEAAATVAAGDTRAIADPARPSYHALWWELHEDLLVTLGRERASEAPA